MTKKTNRQPVLSIVACTDSRGGIGNKGHLLFDIKEDKHNFAMLTRGHTVLMGRATYDSLPNGALPHRRNIVISRTIKSLPDAEVYHSISEALAACADDGEVMVIGGGEVYRETIGMASRLYLTVVNDTAPADTWFPEITKEWHVISRKRLTDMAEFVVMEK